MMKTEIFNDFRIKTIVASEDLQRFYEKTYSDFTTEKNHNDSTTEALQRF